MAELDLKTGINHSLLNAFWNAAKALAKIESDTTEITPDEVLRFLQTDSFMREAEKYCLLYKSNDGASQNLCPLSALEYTELMHSICELVQSGHFHKPAT